MHITEAIRETMKDLQLVEDLMTMLNVGDEGIVRVTNSHAFKNRTTPREILAQGKVTAKDKKSVTIEKKKWNIKSKEYNISRVD